MTDCVRFEQAWQRHFDGEDPCPPSDLTAWDEHLAACSDCQAVDRRFRTLGMALTHWTENQPARRPAVVFQAQHDHSARAISQGARSPSRWRGRAVAGLAAAAALALVAIGPGLRRDRLVPVESVPVAEAPPIAPLAHPLLDTSAVTARLARVVSIPATLFGGEVPSSPGPVPAEPPADALDGAPARIRELGGRVFASFQPLTVRAREAFEFVVPGRPAGRADREPTGRGA